MDSDDYEDEEASPPENSDEDYTGGDDDSEEEESDDSRRKGTKKKQSKAAVPSRATRSTRARARVSYKEQSEDEEDFQADDEDEDQEEEAADSDEDDGTSDEDDSDGSFSGRKRRRTAAAGGGRAPARATRQAAQQTNKRLKRQATADSDEADSDEEYARQLDREINGLRSRPGRRAAATPPSPSPRGNNNRRGSRTSRQASLDSGPTSRRQHRSQRTATQGVSYAEDDDSLSEDGRGGNGKRVREPIAAFDGPGEDEVERVLGHRDAEGVSYNPADPWANREFLIKWMRHAYTHCSWDTRATLEQLAGYKRVLNYMRKVDAEAADVARGIYSREELELRDVERAMEEQLVQQHSQVERILADGEDDEGGTQYLVKWEGLPYSECTWEREEDVLTAGGGPDQMGSWAARATRFTNAVHRPVDVARKQFKLRSTRALEKQPEFLADKLQLRDYQLDGLNWMVYSWSQDRNVILADEMGLGKTVQCVSFLGYLSELQQIRGPFLVVVPLSTVPNWVREFRRWTPQVNTVVYVGDSRSREVIRKFEFDAAEEGGTRSQTRKQFEVLITTYELILKDATILGKVRWNYLVVDEAHRLKNAESALYVELSTWHFTNKLLVTGTPLQNSLRELWALLHFLEPAKFPDADAFEDEYKLQTMDGVSGLHAVLRPHLLRRVIKEVEKSLPPKNERILRVEMTPLQKQYYKWILSRNFRELNKGLKGGQVSLLNIIGELKKVCNHPFLFESAEESFRGREGEQDVAERIVVASGKMVLLDKLLRRLKETGHRVLIFSQMVRVLDIISDYCRLRGWQHQRLDGSTPAAARHASMEHFNAPDSQDFAFLLSTRAGGLGINLATADTVIIFDSDWNPQNDLQAMSRAHRIGQTETVNIYRFVTSGSVEEDILERAKQKMVLDHLVIQRMDTSGRTVLDPQAGKNSAKAMFGKDELAAILRFGAEALFNSNADAHPATGGTGGTGDVAQQTHDAAKAMYEEDIEAILARAEVVDNTAANAAAADTATEGAGGELLSSFNVATFKHEEDDAAFWSRLIPVAERLPDEDQEEELLGPRAARLKAEDALLDADERSKRVAQRAQGGVRRGPPGSDPGPPVEGAALRIEEWRLDVDEEGIPVVQPEGAEVAVRSLCRKDANAFVRAVKRYGLPARIDDICSDVGRGMEDLTHAQKLAVWLVLMDACRRCVALTEADNQDAKDAILDFFGAAVRAQELLAHCAHMRLLARKVAALSAAKSGPAATAAAGDTALPAVTVEVAARFKLEVGVIMPTPKWGKLLGWTPHDDAMLLLGVLLYGIGQWDKMAADPHLGLRDKLACVVSPPPAANNHGHDKADGEGEAPGEKGGGEKENGGKKEATLPKASHMETRVMGLLRKLYQISKAPATAKAPAHAPSGKGRGGLAGARPPPVRVPKPGKFASKALTPEGGVGPAVNGDAPRSGSKDGSGLYHHHAHGGLGSAHKDGGGSGQKPPAKRKVPGANKALLMSPLEDASHEAPRSAKKQKQDGEGAKGPGGHKGKDVGGQHASHQQSEVQVLLEPVLPQIKAWRKLGEDTKLDNKEVVKRMMECLKAIGRHIDQVVKIQSQSGYAAQKEGLQGRLWRQISRATKNERDGEQLMQLYQKIAARQQQKQQQQPQQGQLQQKVQKQQ